MANQHSLSHTGIKITPDAGWDVVSYCDPEGRLYIRLHSPRTSPDVFEWGGRDIGYCMTRAAEKKGYRFMGAYIGHAALRSHQTSATLWDQEGINDYRREDWFHELEARGEYPRDKSRWARCSLNGEFETRGGKTARMHFGRGKSWPNDALPQYVQDRRAGKAPEQQGWQPRTKADAKREANKAKA